MRLFGYGRNIDARVFDIVSARKKFVFGNKLYFVFFGGIYGVDFSGFFVCKYGFSPTAVVMFLFGYFRLVVFFAESSYALCHEFAFRIVVKSEYCGSILAVYFIRVLTARFGNPIKFVSEFFGRRRQKFVKIFNCTYALAYNFTVDYKFQIIINGRIYGVYSDIPARKRVFFPIAVIAVFDR